MNPNNWLKALTIFALVVWIGCSLAVALVTLQHRQTNDQRLCTLSNTLVFSIDRGLAAVTPNEVAKDPVGYRKAYAIDAQLVQTLAAQAPCQIRYKLPKEIQ